MALTGSEQASRPRAPRWRASRAASAVTLEWARRTLALNWARRRAVASLLSSWSQLKARILDAEHLLVQRLAGTVFLIRVGSAVLAFGSQVLFARWMGTFEFGIYLYVWTWVLMLG
jgi:hypothetical protein